jgi:predicted AAA+ superfamily ATPase
LWENFIISELIKQSDNASEVVNYYFWRTRLQQEIDCIKEYNGRLTAFEIKRSTTKKVQRPSSFVQSYPDCSLEIINQQSYLQYL